MKKITYYLAAAMLAAVGLQANAEDDNKMVLNTSDGSTAIPVNTISRLSFDGNTMTIATDEGESKVDVLTLRNITFSLAVQAVDEITKDFGDLNVAFISGVVTADVPDNMFVNIDVYSLGGVRMLAVGAQGHVSADLNALSPGVYVVKVNNKVFKFTR